MSLKNGFILVFVLYICLMRMKCKVNFTNKILVGLEEEHFGDVKSLLIKFRFSQLDKIIPGLYSFKYNGEDIQEVDIQNIKDLSNGKIIFIEQVPEEELHHDMQPSNTEKPFIEEVLTTTSKPNPFCLTPRHGMGVEKAWNTGYNGMGVTIAVNDVGVDYDIPELSSNINLSLSWNFITGNNDVRPERFYEYPKSLALTDHGNRCSGLIASRRENTTCGVGIAYKSTLAVLKPFRVILKLASKDRVAIAYSEDGIVASFTFRSANIDIYSNSWLGNHNRLSLAVKSVLLNGITYGRNGKGSIYVFPSGKMAEGYSNSMYTICVNSFDPYGGKPDNFSEVSACTLTSTFGEGSQRNLNYMVTSSHGNEFTNCTLDFKGTSASCAMVAAMIGLALQANHKLGWRDVQHILVRASDHTGLNETTNFKENGAGFYYHKVFGFGLIDAYKVVTIAETWKNVGPQRLQTEHSSDFRRHPVRKQRSLVSKMEIEIRCKLSDYGCCVDKLEHVIANISYMSLNETNLHIYLLSPAKSKSILLDKGQSDSRLKTYRDHIEFLSVNFWGEVAIGIWTIVVEQFYEENRKVKYKEFGLKSFTLTITGTGPPCNYGLLKPKLKDSGDQSYSISSSLLTYLPKWCFNYIFYTVVILFTKFFEYICKYYYLYI